MFTSTEINRAINYLNQSNSTVNPETVKKAVRELRQYSGLQLALKLQRGY